MQNNNKVIVVTGGAGLLGSTFIKFSSEESSIISNSNAGLFFNKFIPSW